MDQVEGYLQSKDFRQALVRMWVLACDTDSLNAWERERKRKGKAYFESAMSRFADKLQNEDGIDAGEIGHSPLAFIVALDAFVCATSSLSSSHLLSGSPGKAKTFRENGKEYWLLRTRLLARNRAALGKQTGNAVGWFSYHAVVPATTDSGIRVRVQESTARVQDTLEEVSLAARGNLAVWVAHFNDGADVFWDEARKPDGRYRATVVAPHALRVQSIRDTVDRARDEGAHVLVFPEFTIDCAQRSELIARLRESESTSLALVVAGSFHEVDGHDAFNTAPLLGSNGKELMKHRKLRLYGNRLGAAEDVGVGGTIQVLATPVGCFAVLICKDFMDIEKSVASLFQEIPVDWVLVPSFGDEKTMIKHRAKAHVLAYVAPGASSVVANTRNTALDPAGAPLFGFVQAAGTVKPVEPVEAAIDGMLLRLPFDIQGTPTPTPARPSLRRIK